MNVELITVRDLENLKDIILSEVKSLLSKQTENDNWLKTNDARKILGCSNGTLSALRLSGALPYSKINGTIYIKRSDLTHLFNSHMVH